jgi:hypothetical protein
LIAAWLLCVLLDLEFFACCKDFLSAVAQRLVAWQLCTTRS